MFLPSSFPRWFSSFFFFFQMAFFVGLLFFSIAVIPKIDVGLDQELALPRVCFYELFIVWATFKWLSKSQHRENYSSQSEQEQTAHWTNQNSWQLLVNFAKRGKNRKCELRLVFALLLIGWKTSVRFLNQSRSVTIAITYFLTTVFLILFPLFEL